MSRGVMTTTDKERAIWEAHGVYCEGYCCMDNPSNKIYH
ncbi:hypothetical protein 14Stepyanka_00030 [Erwinia phage Stepyanka]|uniref:Uncharacterized protein n=1 Tax=Erwinia phage Stepyanka TaxID=2961688 RepID=A0A9E7NME7_9CAUD|nr:hypothetical protein 14Stepyanka_00030 [Erwinia phage Stepyanka]